MVVVGIVITEIYVYIYDGKQGGNKSMDKLGNLRCKSYVPYVFRSRFARLARSTSRINKK